jgi:hypothetical protein
MYARFIALLSLLAWRRSRGVQSPRRAGPRGVGMEFPHVAGQLFGVGETDALVCRGCGHRASRRRPGDDAAPSPEVRLGISTTSTRPRHACPDYDGREARRASSLRRAGRMHLFRLASSAPGSGGALPGTSFNSSRPSSAGQGRTLMTIRSASSVSSTFLLLSARISAVRLQFVWHLVSSCRRNIR